MNKESKLQKHNCERNAQIGGIFYEVRVCRKLNRFPGFELVDLDEPAAETHCLVK